VICVTPYRAGHNIVRNRAARTSTSPSSTEWWTHGRLSRHSLDEERNAMKKTVRALALAAPVMGMALLAAPAGADPDHYGDNEVVAHLAPVPGNGVQGAGKATVEFEDGGQIDRFELSAWGLLAGAPHAAHIHYGDEARNECPGLGDDTNGDGRLNTTEGVPAYGPIAVSLTTEGDTSPASGLAIDRFDTADDGTLDYSREGLIATSDEVARAIAAGEGVVVIHGVDYNGDGVYSGDVPSDLAPSLPTEATDPALCGVLEDQGDQVAHEDGHEHEHH
jgi:hypothetical protein